MIALSGKSTRLRALMDVSRRLCTSEPELRALRAAGETLETRSLAGEIRGDSGKSRVRRGRIPIAEACDSAS